MNVPNVFVLKLKISFIGILCKDLTMNGNIPTKLYFTNMSRGAIIMKVENGKKTGKSKKRKKLIN